MGFKPISKINSIKYKSSALFCYLRGELKYIRIYGIAYFKC